MLEYEPERGKACIEGEGDPQMVVSGGFRGTVNGGFSPADGSEGAGAGGGAGERGTVVVEL